MAPSSRATRALARRSSRRTRRRRIPRGPRWATTAAATMPCNGFSTARQGLRWRSRWDFDLWTRVNQKSPSSG
eukprot:15200297-Alexandrium_andersonii.AAC.1